MRISGNQRMHEFSKMQCTFNDESPPKCGNAYIKIIEKCPEWNEYCIEELAKIEPTEDISIYFKGSPNKNIYESKSVEYPIVVWNSSWNRASASNDKIFWSIDHGTHLFLVLYNCEQEITDSYLLGCEQCTSAYYESILNTDISYNELRMYKYSKEWQFCRPQMSIFEDQCTQNFCPKGDIDIQGTREFSEHNIWQCRTNYNQDQVHTVNENLISANQGFACWMK